MQSKDVDWWMYTLSITSSSLSSQTYRHQHVRPQNVRTDVKMTIFDHALNKIVFIKDYTF